MRPAPHKDYPWVPPLTHLDEAGRVRRPPPPQRVERRGVVVVRGLVLRPRLRGGPAAGIGGGGAGQRGQGGSERQAPISTPSTSTEPHHAPRQVELQQLRRDAVLAREPRPARPRLGGPAALCLPHLGHPGVEGAHVVPELHDGGLRPREARHACGVSRGQRGACVGNGGSSSSSSSRYTPAAVVTWPSPCVK